MQLWVKSRRGKYVLEAHELPLVRVFVKTRLHSLRCDSTGHGIALRHLWRKCVDYTYNVEL